MWIREVLKRSSGDVYDMTMAYLGDMPFAIGYCSGWEEVKESPFDPEGAQILRSMLEELRPWQHKYHSDGHKTVGEALDCFRSYIMDQKVKWRRTDECDFKCQAEGCKEITEAHWLFDGVIYSLCDNHRDVKSLSKILVIPERFIGKT